MSAVRVVRELEGRLKTTIRRQGQVQDVIILQQNTAPPQEEKSTVLQQEGQKVEQGYSPPSFALGAHPGGGFMRTDRLKGEKEMPLLFLESSYPFYHCFYPIMFPY